MTTEAKVEEKHVRTPFGAAKPISVLLAVLLALSMLAACILGILRSTLSSDGISRIITAMMSGDSAMLPGMLHVSAAEGAGDILGGMSTDKIVDAAFDLGLEDILEEYGITRDNLGAIIERSTFREFAAKNGSKIAMTFLEGGSVSDAVDPDTIVSFVRENEDVIYDVTGNRITEEQYEKLKNRLPDVVSKIDRSVGTVKDTVGVGIYAFRAITSPTWYIAAIAAAVVLALLILVLHKFLLGRSLSYIAVPTLVVGIITLLTAAVVFFIGGSVMGGALSAVFSAINVSILIRAAIYTVVGIVLLIVKRPLAAHNI